MTTTMLPLTHRSPKLGDVPYAPEDVVRFDEGLPGFEALREFLLVTRSECAPFVFLASLEQPDVALPLLPWALVAGTAVPPVPDDAARKGASYAVVAIAPEAREMLVNLRAPVVVDLETRRGSQWILADESLPLAAPLGV